ncbi:MULTISPECIES: hypothetical protein [Bradyrhizobium]|uniref:DUF4288 domain-containing protein n=2 Tax=Bradyrhizobium TaxID=374 RepID=A0ABY0Q726_9BRAD|nr:MULTISPECIES: hypothetical protein [Bradyrhizobium]SDJ63110.1 hypothetical protein SAMN05444163_5980 [Bradyrhizobium ottawaense]SEC33837.1 hypothetical protein SAMN05444171_1179 [Bradyrhizobium lablabi]
MPNPLGLIFTIEVAGRPTVSFEARQLREASELCHEEWFRSDLNALSSNGEPVYKIGAKLKARIANEAEGAKYREASPKMEVSDDIFMVYLVTLDAVGLP